jgi:glycerophosphoryl diester phosphodiesterase
MVEFDVRATADGRMVILHDPSVDRTTDGSGQIWELSFEEVSKLDASAGHADYAGTRMPTLQEVLDFLPRGIELNIHVYPGPEDGAAIVNSVCEEIRVRDLYASAFIAGDVRVTELIVSTDSRVRRCLLEFASESATYVQRSTEMGCSNLQPSNKITTSQLCEEAHRLGLIVHPYYADDETEMLRLIECGVDGILTNDPKLLIELLENR